MEEETEAASGAEATEAEVEEAADQGGTLDHQPKSSKSDLLIRSSKANLSANALIKMYRFSEGNLRTYRARYGFTPFKRVEIVLAVV